MTASAATTPGTRALRDVREEPSKFALPVISADRDRRADGHQSAQAKDVRVAHANAPVRDAAWDQVRLVRPVDSDEPAARPVREDGRARARAERDRAVERIREIRELLADVERARRRRPTRLPDRHGCTKDGLAAVEQRRRQSGDVDDEARVDELVAAERGTGDPADRAVRQGGEA